LSAQHDNINAISEGVDEDNDKLWEEEDDSDDEHNDILMSAREGCKQQCNGH